MEEREIPGFPGYFVTRDGRVRGRRGWFLSSKNRGRYPNVTLYCETDGRWYGRKVHVLVCLTYNGPKPDGAYEVRHLNDDPNDNRAENLIWGTHEENMQDMSRLGTTRALTPKQVEDIRFRLWVGEQGRLLAQEYGVDGSVISHVKNRKGAYA